MRDVRVTFPKPCDEAWDEMTPAGCDRHCGRCDRVIHDLSHYTIDQVEAVIQADPHSCVRAHIGADGVVALKPGHGAKARRLVVAIGASVGLLTASGVAIAKPTRPGGEIVGKIDGMIFQAAVTATRADGTSYSAKIKLNGKYRIRGLPAGSYKLTFSNYCNDREDWTLDTPVVVEDGVTKVPTPEDMPVCIIVGMVLIDKHRISG